RELRRDNSNRFRLAQGDRIEFKILPLLRLAKCRNGLSGEFRTCNIDNKDAVAAITFEAIISTSIKGLTHGRSTRVRVRDGYFRKVPVWNSFHSDFSVYIGCLQFRGVE